MDGPSRRLHNVVSSTRTVAHYQTASWHRAQRDLFRDLFTPGSEKSAWPSPLSDSFIILLTTCCSLFCYHSVEIADLPSRTQPSVLVFAAAALRCSRRSPQAAQACRPCLDYFRSPLSPRQWYYAFDLMMAMITFVSARYLRVETVMEVTRSLAMLRRRSRLALNGGRPSSKLAAVRDAPSAPTMASSRIVTIQRCIAQ